MSRPCFLNTALAVSQYRSGMSYSRIGKLQGVSTSEVKAALRKELGWVKNHYTKRAAVQKQHRPDNGAKYMPTEEQILEHAAQIRAGLSEEELVKRAPYLAIVPADTHVIAESDIRAGRRGGVHS